MSISDVDGHQPRGLRESVPATRRRRRVLTAAAAVVLLLASACSSSVEVTQGELGTPAPVADPTAAPTPPPASTATPSPPPTVAATPTPEPSPTATPEPTPVDTTPVVMQGDGWVVTEADIARLSAFVEDTHELSFTSAVTVLTSRDIGLEYAANFEPFNADEWYALQALGLAEAAVDRDVANQVRRDRIRGLCCRFEGGTQVVVEVEATKLETEMIIVHELTHALHTQHPDLFERRRFEAAETPRPFAGAIEGVPQFIAFAYFDAADSEEQAVVAPELEIIRPDMVALIGSGPSQHLNFSYTTGAEFVEQVVAERGPIGLSELMASPPTTTEQILFPSKYLAGEVGAPVTPPPEPGVGTFLAEGTLGAAMLMFALVDSQGAEQALELVEAWAGDWYVAYELSDQVCSLMNIALDADADADFFAQALADALRPSFPDVEAASTDDVVQIATCPQTG